jgi:DNA-binding XRE family transcriptional regulator
MLAKAFSLLYSIHEEFDMPQSNLLSKSPPYAVEETVKTLGRNLRIARIRRNMTIADAAERIGAGVRSVRDVEHGKTTSSISVYYALMWLYDMLPAPSQLADPDIDTEGKRLAGLREPKRASYGKGLNNDF